MQESFLKVWKHWDRIRTMDDPTGYLYRTAMNAFRSRWRRRAMERRVAVRRPEPSDPLRSVERRAAVLHALTGLPRRKRAALVLTAYLGFPPDEAAGILGVQASTVRSLASQARAEIRRELEIDDG